MAWASLFNHRSSESDFLFCSQAEETVYRAHVIRLGLLVLFIALHNHGSAHLIT